jgi:hypothetical protein
VGKPRFGTAWQELVDAGLIVKERAKGLRNVERDRWKLSAEPPPKARLMGSEGAS